MLTFSSLQIQPLFNLSHIFSNFTYVVKITVRWLYTQVKQVLYYLRMPFSIKITLKIIDKTCVCVCVIQHKHLCLFYFMNVGFLCFFTYVMVYTKYNIYFQVFIPMEDSSSIKSNDSATLIQEYEFVDQGVTVSLFKITNICFGLGIYVVWVCFSKIVKRI